MKKILAYGIASLFLFSCKKEKDVPVVDCYTGAARMDTAVLLVLGQSNAANAGETKYTATCALAKNFYNGEFFRLADPLKGANGEGGSVWSRLGDILLQQHFCKTVIIAPAAVGGTSVHQWKPGGALNHLIVETVAQLQSKGLTITHVLWHQGESDHALLHPSSSAAENAQQYRDAFLELVAQLRSLHVDAPVFIATATRCGNSPDYVLQNAQRGLADDSLQIYRGPNTDMLGSEYRYDDCHFNESGLMVHALLWADILISH